MIFLMTRKCIGGKGQKPTDLRRETKTLSFSMRKHRKGENKILSWAFGTSRGNGVMMKKALPKLLSLTLITYTAPPTQAELRK